jgi:hypothetical protein
LEGGNLRGNLVYGSAQPSLFLVCLPLEVVLI